MNILNIKLKKSVFKFQKGFSMVEALLAISVFVLMAASFSGSIFYGQESSVISGFSTQATMLAEEGIEAVRNMRDANFSNLSNGTHGLSFSGGEWIFSGSSDETDGFARSIEISDIDANTKLVTSNVSWSYGTQRSGTISIPTRISNWKAYNPTQAEHLSVDVSGAIIFTGATFYVDGMNIENTGNEDISIASTQVSWNGVPGNRKLEYISMDGSDVWTGSDGSDSVQDISDFSMAVGSGPKPMILGFSHDIDGISLTIIFIMSDGSTKQIVFSPGSIADIISPSDITDLSASGPTSSSINLSWTSPGDDADIGTASSYDIRYSTSTIDNGNWDMALQVSGEPTPSVAGTSQSMTVSGLSVATTYFFAIKTSDEISNVSGISNIASATTLAPPQANYLVVNTSTTALSADKRDVLNITLQNSGSSNITISSMSVSWSGVSANRRLRNISINGVASWSGNANSGATQNITDVTISSGATVPLNYLRYSNTVSNIIISITFTMSDGSSKTVSGIGPLL